MSIPKKPAERKWLCGAGLLLVVLGIIPYFNSFSGIFTFDDIDSIVNNTSLRDITNWPLVLWPPSRNGTTVDGRPLLNLSLALNYTVHGLQREGYHVTNLALHLVCGLLLWQVLREALRTAQISPSIRQRAEGLAWLIALLWIVHPLTTAAVTYVIQRAEILMALFALATAVCFLRGCRLESKLWLGIACGVGGVGQFAKEVMAMIPLVLLLLDIGIVTGSFREPWLRRGRWHLGNTILCWLFAAALILSQGGRSGTVGGKRLSDHVDYLAVQAGFILRYLSLSLIPVGQVFDYGIDVPPLHWGQLPQFVVVTAMFLGTVYLFWKRPALGILGLLFFLILGPTSSVIPVVTHTAAEHRMYLPLAFVLVAVVLGIDWLLQFVGDGRDNSSPIHQRWLFVGLCVVAVLFAGLTYRRNSHYASARALWGESVRVWPINPRACVSFRDALLEAGEGERAPNLFDTAIEIPHQRATALCGRAESWAKLNQMEPARQDLRAALAHDAECSQAHNNLGIIAIVTDQPQEALEHFAAAIRINPEETQAFLNRGNLHFRMGNRTAARKDYETALQTLPSEANCHFALARLAHEENRLREAELGYERAIFYHYRHADSWISLISLWLDEGRVEEAFVRVKKLLTKEPDHPAADSLRELLATAVPTAKPVPGKPGR